jgi:hypothetical protein
MGQKRMITSGWSSRSRTSCARTLAGITLVLLVGCHPESLALRNGVEAIKRAEMIRAAESTYHERYRRYGTLADLGPSGADMIPGDLAVGDVEGYRYQIELTPAGYKATAWPIEYGKTGYRSLYFDETGIFRESWTAERAKASDKFGSL